MANLFDEIRRKELYGPGRNQYAEQLRKTLNKSHVLQAGEYNYSQKSLGEGVWKTTHSSDFSKGLAVLITSYTFITLHASIITSQSVRLARWCINCDVALHISANL